MLFNYQALDQAGQKKEGSIEAINTDVAIISLQRRGLTITSIKDANPLNFATKGFSFFQRVPHKDIVILSRQLSTLFEAQVSALRVFRMMSGETPNLLLRKKLAEIADDIQAGSSISGALAKHNTVFNEFYVNMVRAGEESGKLNETFLYLADYLDRSYELASKARNALVYPAFVIFTFFGVMILMFTVVIPKISGLITESGQEIPIYTKIVLWISTFFVSYGFVLAAVVAAGFFLLYRWVRTPNGKRSFDTLKLALPLIGGLYRKLYLARLADNMNTMLLSGIPMVKALDLTSSVVDNVIYKEILGKAVSDVKSGHSVSEALSTNGEIPGIMIQMIRVGEETGELGQILKTLANFYSREVRTAVDTLVDMIEPAMIVALGLGVGFLLAAVLMPIYNISSSM